MAIDREWRVGEDGEGLGACVGVEVDVGYSGLV